MCEKNNIMTPKLHNLKASNFRAVLTMSDRGETRIFSRNKTKNLAGDINFSKV